MNAEQFIEAAIERGQRKGVPLLDPLERMIFLLSELEVSCDKDGIDSFLDRYGASELIAVAEILRDSGAIATADGLTRIASALPHRDNAVLSAVNELVADRAGYGYGSVAIVVASRLVSERP